jgi:hypothetical protein
MITRLAEGADGGRGLLCDLVAFTPGEWMLAIIAAIIAAALLDVIALIRRAVTSRLPFLILRLTRLTLPAADWRSFYKVWEADLHDIMTADDELRPGARYRRYVRALGFSLGLVFGGAMRTRRASESMAPARRLRNRNLLVVYLAIDVVTTSAGALFLIPHTPRGYAFDVFLAAVMMRQSWSLTQKQGRHRKV